MTNKSKFGLSAGLMGAFVYLVGGFSITGLVLLLIAVAMWEENEFVKVCAGRVAFIYLAYNLVEDAFSVLHSFLMKLSFIGTSSVGIFLANMNSAVWSWLWIAYRAFIIVLAFLAIFKPEAKLNFIDNLMAKLSKEAVVKISGKKCPECGKEVAENTAFCTGCGHKFE